MDGMDQPSAFYRTVVGLGLVHADLRQKYFRNPLAREVIMSHYDYEDRAY